jgi:hypothetical protein
MNLYNYIFNSKNNEINEIRKLEINTKPVLINRPISRKKDTIYIVSNKATDTILGAYDNLTLAKSNGQKATYNNCSIIQVKLNGGCNHINKIVFEDK